MPKIIMVGGVAAGEEVSFPHAAPKEFVVPHQPNAEWERFAVNPTSFPIENHVYEVHMIRVGEKWDGTEIFRFFATPKGWPTERLFEELINGYRKYQNERIPTDKS